jgi:hypothetical protein
VFQDESHLLRRQVLRIGRGEDRGEFGLGHGHQVAMDGGAGRLGSTEAAVVTSLAWRFGRVRCGRRAADALREGRQILAVPA